jgi:regulator of cell morphogenesis and NO signaling
MINPSMSVREVAVEFPQSTSLFERLKIDYCCGGNRPLSEACASIGVEVGEVIEMLGAARQAEPQGNGAKDFQQLTLSELVAYIVETNHVFTRQEMARLEVLSKKVISAHGENHPELHRVGGLFEALCADLKPHMFKEEQILFPYILGLVQADSQNRPAPFAPFGTVDNPIRMMMMEHDTAGEILRDLRTITSDYNTPPDGCISYRTLYEALAAFERDLHQHIHLENNILFPRAIEPEARMTA